MSDDKAATLGVTVVLCALFAAVALSPDDPGKVCNRACGVASVLTCEIANGKVTKVECKR